MYIITGRCPSFTGVISDMHKPSIITIIKTRLAIPEINEPTEEI